MDRFTRFKVLRALWARARTLLAWLSTPHEREARQRAFRWQQINSAERQIRDGIVRSTGDPDSYVRPQTSERQGTDRQLWQAQQARQQWDQQQRQAQEAQQRQHQRRR